jgi:hypothetical protein
LKRLENRLLRHHGGGLWKQRALSLKWLFRIKLYIVNYRWNGQWYSLALEKIIQLGSNGASE